MDFNFLLSRKTNNKIYQTKNYRDPANFTENIKKAIMALPDDKLKKLAIKFIQKMDEPTASDLKKLLIEQQDNIFKLL